MRGLKRALVAGLVLVLLAGVATAAVRQLEVTTLPKPQWTRGGASGTAGVRLVLVSSRRNEITDTSAWFARNRLQTREAALGPLSGGALGSFQGAGLIRAIRQGDVLLLTYGRDFASGRYLVARESNRPQYAFDFVNYVFAPNGAGYQSVVWAAQAAGVLYVETSDAGYARESDGLNAYVTAIDVKTKKVRWRSRPLVANAFTFEVVGNVIVTGYGFTDEADYLYLLDRRTGRVAQRLSVPSAPEFIIRRGNLLYVRTYDHDLVVKLKRKR